MELESLSSFSVDSFVPVLVSLLNHESNADIILLATQALTYLCEVLPSSCSTLVQFHDDVRVRESKKHMSSMPRWTRAK